MSKKLLNKVISAILVLAVCSTAFLGCVVSAETTTCSATYEIEGQNCAEVGEDIRAIVTISSNNLFVAGIFTVTVDNPLDFADINVSAISGKDADGNTVTAPEVYFNAEKNKILFQCWKDSELALVEYSEISIELIFKPTGENKIEAGTVYEIDIDSIDVTDKDENTYSITGQAGSVHVHTYGTGDVNGDTTTYTCTVTDCGATKKEITKSDVLEDVREVNFVNKMTVTFTAGGELILNFLTNANASFENVEIDTVYLAKINADNTITLISTAGKIEGFDAYQHVYIGGAKTIADTVNAVFVGMKNGEITCKGASISASIANYCKTVIDDDSKEEKAQAYCKGLLSYGRASADYFKTGFTFDGIENYIYTDAELNSTALDGNDFANETNIANGWSFASVNVRAYTKPVLRLAFNINNANLGSLSLKVTYNGVTKEIKASELTSAGNDKYYIDIDDIPTKKMRDPVRVENSANAEQYCEYSVETYAKLMTDKEHASAKLCKTLIAYSDALVDAFDS